MLYTKSMGLIPVSLSLLAKSVVKEKDDNSE